MSDYEAERSRTTAGGLEGSPSSRVEQVAREGESPFREDDSAAAGVAVLSNN